MLYFSSYLIALVVFGVICTNIVLLEYNKNDTYNDSEEEQLQQQQQHHRKLTIEQQQQNQKRSSDGVADVSTNKGTNCDNQWSEICLDYIGPQSLSSSSKIDSSNIDRDIEENNNNNNNNNNDQHQQQRVISTTHCVGGGQRKKYINKNVDNNNNNNNDDDDDDNDTTWMYRSCQFEQLCFNIQTNEYILFPSDEEIALNDDLSVLQDTDETRKTTTKTTNYFDNVDFYPYEVSTIATTTPIVSNDGSNSKNTKRRFVPGVAVAPLGFQYGTEFSKGIKTNTNRKLHRYNDDDEQQTPWFPKVVTSSKERQQLLSAGYYQLPSSVVLLPTINFPYSSSTTRNTYESIVWNYLYSIHTLLHMFGFVSDNDTNTNTSTDTYYQPLLVSSQTGVPISIPTELYALLGNVRMPVQKQAAIEFHKTPHTNIVCSHHAVAGMGMFAFSSTIPSSSSSSNNSDESSIDQQRRQYQIDPTLESTFPNTYTVHRGANMYDFRLQTLRKFAINQHIDFNKIKKGLSIYKRPIKVTIMIPSNEQWMVQHNMTHPETHAVLEMYNSIVQKLQQVLSLHNKEEGEEEDTIVVELINETDYLQSQINKVIDSLAHITLSCHRTVVSTFLPIGSSLIILNNDITDNNESATTNKDQCMLLERSVLNVVGYLRVRWINSLSNNNNNNPNAIVNTILKHIQNGIDNLT